MGERRAKHVTCNAEGENDKQKGPQDENGRGRVARWEGVRLVDV